MSQDQAPAIAPSRRRRLFGILGTVVGAAAVIWLIYWILVGSKHVETDNAYVQASNAQVTALVSGALVSIPVHETQAVKEGDILAVIDPQDFRLAVERARADLDQAQRHVRQYFANDRALAAQSAVRTSDIDRAQAELRRAEVEFGRRKALSADGAVSGDELTSAETQLAAARSVLAQAKAAATAAAAQQDAAGAMTIGSDLSSNPEVVSARARLAQAELDLSRTTVRAPVTGVVTRNTVEVGQKIATGAPMMVIVPVQDAYVEANFKEVQLRNVAIGQPVELTSDLYGDKVKYTGKVIGLSGGTGSAFSVIPAQNATGNWIKVVQRIPVRIALEPKELVAHPLRVGLSMTAVIDTSKQ